MKKILIALILTPFLFLPAFAQDEDDDYYNEDQAGSHEFYYDEDGSLDGFSINQPNAKFYFDDEGRMEGYTIKIPQTKQSAPYNPYNSNYPKMYDPNSSKMYDPYHVNPYNQ